MNERTFIISHVAGACHNDFLSECNRPRSSDKTQPKLREVITKISQVSTIKRIRALWNNEDAKNCQCIVNVVSGIADIVIPFFAYIITSWLIIGNTSLLH